MNTKLQPQVFSCKRLSKAEINEFPLIKYEGQIHLVRSQEQLTSAVNALEKEKILGFDTETRPSFRKGEHHLPALIQLAGEKGAYIFQLKLLGFPKPLISILENKDIVKAGVSIDHDLSELEHLAEFEPEGFVDLGDVAKNIGIQNHGLRGLSAVVLGGRISKGASTSNWESNNLSHSQVIYAATDAWVGLELYKKLQNVEY
jgi:ribonuclease D